MISPADGVVFTTAADGDMRRDVAARRRATDGREWATVRQVHGAAVIAADRPGDHGEADGLVSTSAGLPLAVFTADCLGVVIQGADGVAVVHAGWRGAAAGVVAAGARAVGEVHRAAIGPHIRSCCFEVGPEVAAHFPDHLATTKTGTTSVDLAAVVSDQLPVEPTVIDVCTRCGADTFSHRRDGSPARLAAIGWVP